jgi:transglutaminase-like putative cysteine protease
MNYRLTIAAAFAVILASFSEFSLIHGAAWMVEAVGAVLVVALAGTLTRMSPGPAAIGATLLTAIAAAPLLAAESPLLKATGGAIIALCATSASGLRPFRAVAGLATYLAGLLLYLNLLHAARQSFFAVIPTPQSVHHLARLAGEGASASRFAPPVPASSGVILLAAGSIGLAAIAVDFLAVRLHRPAIAGLPLLVVFIAPIATTADMRGFPAAIAFLLAATGYLALLAADGRSRLRGWGRVITVWHYANDDERLAGADVGALAATGRRIGLTAVCAALVAPLLLPALTLHHLFGGHGGGSGGSGTHGVGLPDPVAQLHGLLIRSSPQRVLTYRTTVNDPANYLQVYVLNYDNSASRWDLVRPTGGTRVGPGQLIPAPGLEAGTPQTFITSKITILRTGGFSGPIDFLPAPYWPIQVHVPGSWRESPQTLMIYSDSPITGSLHYTVKSGQVEPTASTLAVTEPIPGPIRHSYLDFKSSVTPKLKKFALRVTKGKTTPFAKAVALEQWFLSNRFSYSLQSTVPNSPAGLLDFLKTTRQGFCQQFAFAMAVLARLIGIPSRIAIGYTAGQQHANGTWVVTTSDAHAWPELYFSGAGWLRFEPTPGGFGGQQTAVEPSYVYTAGPGGNPSTRSGGQNNSSPGAPTSPGGGPGHRLQVGNTSSSAGGGRLPHGSAPVGWIILAVAALAAVLPGGTRVVTRRRRWHTAGGDAALAAAAWRELCADLDDYGLPCRACESPRAVARRVRSVSGLDEQAGLAISRIATVVERARYARAPGAAGAIRADVTLVRRGLARGASRGTRWRARLLPASTLRPLRTWIRQAAGLLTGWMPAAGEG